MKNKGVEMSCKSDTTQVYKVVGTNVELSATIKKPKSYIKTSTSIR